MKSKDNVIYQRDLLIILTNLYIDDLVNRLENKELVLDLKEKTYNIQNLINTTKILDWIANTDNDCNLDDYYDSTLEITLDKQFRIDKLNDLLKIN